MATHSDWKMRLDQAVRACKAEVIGHSHIQHVHHGLVVMVAILAFGDDKRAHFYIEGLAPQTNIPRPDLILLHPDLGIVVIENKGVALNDIHRVQNTTLSVVRDGRLKDEDPFVQADRVHHRLRDMILKRMSPNEVLFNRTAALPRIKRAEFTEKFGVKWPVETLFAEECLDPTRFRERLLHQAETTFRGSPRRSRLTPRACTVAMGILNGNGVFYSPRRTLVDATDRNLLGVQIEELELGLKEPTQQQLELGRQDLRGKHRLFRGVAGSGKSIMLAMSVAYSLVRFREEGQSLFEEKPKRRILVVCFNRALVQYLWQKIDDRYGSMTWDAVPENEVTVTNLERLIYRIESDVPALKTGLDFREKEERARLLKKGIAELAQADTGKIQFDAIYIDEAQDLAPAEVELLSALAKKDAAGNQTLVIFYDNAQNIFGVTTPVWQKHGIDIVGRTTYLDSCLRNTRQTLEMAFNVLVGSFAPEDQKVTTREFADMAALRQRKLVEESGDRLEIKFAPRTGPHPIVKTFQTADAEVDWAVNEIDRLITMEKVLPSDILVVYKTQKAFKELERRLSVKLGERCQLRFVDDDHRANKDKCLIEDGFLTVSTIASAKGYDAPIVFVLGADLIATDTQGRAGFYVAATRAKFQLIVSGVVDPKPSLLNEIIKTSNAFAPKAASILPRPSGTIPVSNSGTPTTRHSAKAVSEIAGQVPMCKFCRSQNVHGQHGRYGYFFKCIECLKNTKMEPICSKCGKDTKVRKSRMEFFSECAACKISELLHRNVRLDDLED